MFKRADNVMNKQEVSVEGNNNTVIIDKKNTNSHLTFVPPQSA